MEHYKFFQNRACEYFPCHEGADHDRFNCLFCYCPLYALGDKCGGAFTYTHDGFKDCSRCLRPHNPDRFDEITARYRDIAELARRKP